MRAFEWAEAASVDDAIKLLAPSDAHADPDSQSRPMGGGQDLLTTMKADITRPPRVVSLKAIDGLSGIKRNGDGSFVIGASTTITDLHENADVQKYLPGLADAAHSIATPQIRNLGTVGGNLCQRPRCWYYRLESVVCLKKGGNTCYAKDGENKYHAILGGGPSYIVHPSDLAPMLVALDASVSVQGAKGSRTILLSEFFTLPRDASVRKENVLADGDVITAINVPASPVNGRSTYLKFKERESLDFAMSSVAAALEMNADGTVKQARLVLGGVAPIPWRVLKAEAALVGKKIDDATLKGAAEIALAGAQPLAQNGYKIPLTKTLVRRALTKAANLPGRA